MDGFEPRGDDYNFNRSVVHAYGLDDCRLSSKRRFMCDACGNAQHISKFERAGEPFSQPNLSPKFYGRKTCMACRAGVIRSLTKHPLYSAEVAAFFGKVASGMRVGAKGRSIPCVIDAADLIEMYLRQNGECAITGLKLKLEVGKGARDKRGWLKPSVDRIDSRGFYTLSNIHIVAQAVNLMKFDLPMDLFFEFCERITERRMSGAI